MRFLLAALTLFLTLSSVFNWDPGPAPGVKIKNFLLYLLVSGLVMGCGGSPLQPKVNACTRSTGADPGACLAVAENYLVLQDAPNPGTWGCESATPVSLHGGAVQTNSDGAKRRGPASSVSASMEKRAMGQEERNLT